MLLFLLLSYSYTDCNTEFGYCRFTNYVTGSSTQNVDNNTCNLYANNFNVLYLNTESLSNGICIEYRNSTGSIIKFEMKNITEKDKCLTNFVCTNSSTCTSNNFMSESFNDFQYVSCIETNPDPPPLTPLPSPPFPFPPPSPPGFKNSCDKYLFRKTNFVNSINVIYPNTILNGFINLNALEIEPVKEEYNIYSNHVYKKTLKNKNFLNFIETPRNFPGISNEELVEDARSEPILKCCNLCDSKFSKCGGFNVVVTETDVLCIFVSTQESSNEYYLNYTFDDDSFYHKRTFSYRHSDKFKIETFSPSPSLPPMPFPTAPAPVIPPWYLTFLQPEIFIPSILGGIVLLIVFIYLFRECTSERANAFSSVIDSILGRQKTEVIVA